MTAADFKVAVKELTAPVNSAATNPEPAEKRYVYGIQGIADLFRVSKPTASLYKRTWLAPAVSQRGRKIITDAEMAMSLFVAYKTQSTR